MKIDTKIGTALAGLGLALIMCLILLIYSNERSRQTQTQFALNYETITQLQSLDTLVHDAFLHLQHDTFGYNANPHVDLEGEQSKITKKFSEVREFWLQRSAMLNWSEEQLILELGPIIKLQNEVDQAFSELKLAKSEIDGDDPEGGRERAEHTFSVSIERMFGDIMDQKINNERIKVEGFERSVMTSGALSFTWTIVVAIISLMMISYSFFVYQWQIRSSLSTLHAGAKRINDGELDHLIPLVSNDEFGDVSAALNSVSSRLSSTQFDLKFERSELESKVDTRTQQLASANEELKRQDELRRQFFADIGHELRTPVTAIRGQAEVALRAKVDKLENQSLALEKIVSLSEQLTQDVSALFFIAREQAGVVDLRREALDLGELVEQAVSNMSAFFEREHAEVSLDIDTESSLLIEGTGSRLTQLINTLLTNAILHSQVGVRVHLILKGTVDQVLLTISDDGPGIPITERDRVFERFYRVGQSQATAPGSGLGLPIARSLVQAHGGVIRINEGQMGGTEIRISFPLSGADQS